jgi:uncharacterized protein YbbC (DUF1343 family)
MKFARKSGYFLLLLLVAYPYARTQVRTGAEILLEKKLNLLQGKRVGVICNHTSILPNGTHLIDTLLKRGITITALFAPEHGIRGKAAAGEEVSDGKDTQTGLSVYSLYGKTVKPAAEMLKDVDVLVFDIQDVGARFYTYMSTMALCMQAAAENSKPFIALDRPNPINGVTIEGPVLDTALKSFVGMFPIPVRHGMTAGELAKMIAGEKWLGRDLKIDLTVIKMEGWKRMMWYDETSLPWNPPSPNMKTLATATVYPGTCFFEGTNVTEGRGTEKPFEYIGAPWIEKDSLALALNGMSLSGVKFEPIEFTPKADSIAAPNPKFNGELCNGISIHVLDRNAFRPVEASLAILLMIQKLYPGKLEIKSGQFDRLTGRKEIREGVQTGASLKRLQEVQSENLKRFESLRRKYLLY